MTTRHGTALHGLLGRGVYCAAVDLIADTVNAVAKLAECSGKVAVLGYCLNGLMAFLTAVRYGVDAAVAYHGGETDKYLDEAGDLHAPLLMHLAEEDVHLNFVNRASGLAMRSFLRRGPQRIRRVGTGT